MKIEIANGRPWFYQWDTNQQLVISDDGRCSEVHFANAETVEALVCRIDDKDGVRTVKVPNLLLQKDVPVIAYLYNQEMEKNQTCEAKCFQVRRRPKPADYVYTETEIWAYKKLEERIRFLEESVGGEVVEDAVRQYMEENPVTAEMIGAVSSEMLPLALNDALKQAEASGAFRGEKGDTPVKGEDYYTDADKAEMVSAVIDALPKYDGEVAEV